MNKYVEYGGIDKLLPLPGGICRVLLLPHHFIEKFPKVNPATNAVEDYFNFKPGSSVLQFLFSENSKIFNQELKVGSGGAYYSLLLQAKLKGYSDWADHIMNSYAGTKVIAFIHDRAGFWRVMGSKDSAAPFTYSYSTSDLKGERECIVKLSIDQKFPSFIISNDVILNLPINGNTPPVSIFYLLNEDGSYLLNEDGYKIIL